MSTRHTLHLAGLVARLAGAVADAAQRGHVTAGDAVNIVADVADGYLSDNDLAQTDVLHFHPYQKHPEHPDPDQRD